MRTKLQLLAIFIIAALDTLFAQGPLIPPGAPAPTMKTLDQIEARTPISSAPFTISQPGSYYITANLTVSSGDAITIAAHGVTLDLNGFTIFSTEANATGIGISMFSPRDVTIMNGHIRGSVVNSGGVYTGSGFGYGIDRGGSFPVNVLISRVSVSGCRFGGIVIGAGSSAVVESCMVQTVGGFGIDASIVKQSTAMDCGSYAIVGSVVSDCLGESRMGAGISASDTAQNCRGFSSSGNGLSATTAVNCSGRSGAGQGLFAIVATGCRGESSSGTGLHGDYMATNCLGISSSGRGLYASKIATSCFGETSSAGTVGLFSEAAANYCSGSNLGGGPAMQADNAIGCTTFNGAIIAGQKFLGTP